MCVCVRARAHLRVWCKYIHVLSVKPPVCAVMSGTVCYTCVHCPLSVEEEVRGYRGGEEQPRTQPD